jgi:hypothetical protein
MQQESLADDGLGDPDAGYDYEQLAAEMLGDGLGSGGSGSGEEGAWPVARRLGCSALSQAARGPPPALVARRTCLHQQPRHAFG